MEPYDFDPALGSGQVVIATPRLLLRRLTAADAGALLAFMQKPTVMYAWEHGFTREDVDSWIERQTARYRTDGYGYWGIMLRGGERTTPAGAAAMPRRPPAPVWPMRSGRWAWTRFLPPSARRTGPRCAWPALWAWRSGAATPSFTVESACPTCFSGPGALAAVFQWTIDN